MSVHVRIGFGAVAGALCGALLGAAGYYVQTRSLRSSEQELEMSHPFLLRIPGTTVFLAPIHEALGCSDARFTNLLGLLEQLTVAKNPGLAHRLAADAGRAYSSLTKVLRSDPNLVSLSEHCDENSFFEAADALVHNMIVEQRDPAE